MAEFVEADGTRWQFDFDAGRCVGQLSGTETNNEVVEIHDGFLPEYFDLLSPAIHQWLAERMARAGQRLNSTCLLGRLEKTLTEFGALSPEQQAETLRRMEQFREAMRTEAGSATDQGDEFEDESDDDADWESAN